MTNDDPEELSERPVVVLGAGGHAKVVLATLLAARADVRGLYADDHETRPSHLFGVPIEGPVSEAPDRGVSALVAVGDNRTRETLARRLERRWARAVHPSALIERDVEIGEGTVVFAGAVVQPGSRIGAHCIVNTGAQIDHDARIGDFAHVGPGVVLAGDVTVEEGAFLGAGAVVIPGRRIGAWSTVGAGGVVAADVLAASTVAGVPARELDAGSTETKRQP